MKVLNPLQLFAFGNSFTTVKNFGRFSFAPLARYYYYYSSSYNF